MKKELKNTRLVQRLIKPCEAKGKKMQLVSELFSFGGGLENGGLSDDAMSLLRPIFSFDYMGSSEFEWGAIPKFFQRTAENVNLFSGWEIEINKTPIFVIGQIELQKQIEKRIKELAKNKCWLKEFSLFDVAVGLNKYAKKKDCKTIGWLELDNTFAFFVDEEAFNAMIKFFGVLNKD